MSRTDAHTPLWVLKLNPNFDEYRALQQGLRLCACLMCYGTEQIKHRRSIIRAEQRRLLVDLRKTPQEDLLDIDDFISERRDAWIAYR